MSAPGGGAGRRRSLRLRTSARLTALLLTASSAAAAPESPPKGVARATFAGGCFWSMEAPFDQIAGVLSTTAGYAGGAEKNPTYEQVASGRTSHAEVVQVVFDPAKVAYERLLEVFWRHIDPFDAGGQFCDRGRHYRTAVFFDSEAQRQAAFASRLGLERQALPAPIATEIVPLGAFYPAEAEHQDFYQRNVRRYWSYRAGCGRDARLKQLWGK